MFDLTDSEIENGELAVLAKAKGYSSLKSLLNDNSMWGVDEKEVREFLEAQGQIVVGSTVMVKEEGLEAKVIRIEKDGDLYVRFEDGEEGCYSLDEVEAV